MENKQYLKPPTGMIHGLEHDLTKTSLLQNDH
jgi:hypothetical protein